MKDLRWTNAERRDEVASASIGCHLVQSDTRIVTDDGWYMLLTPSAPRGPLNEVVRARIQKDVSGRVDRAIETYRAHDVGWRWVCAPDSEPQAELEKTLATRASNAWRSAGMTADPARLRLPLRRGVTVREATTAELLAIYAAVFAEGWGDVASSIETLKWASRHRRHHNFVAYVDGHPCGVAAYQAKKRSAYLMGGLVLPAFRGRGAYPALIEARLRSAEREGLTLATTQARLATSAPILEHIGFRTEYEFEVFEGD